MIKKILLTSLLFSNLYANTPQKSISLENNICIKNEQKKNEHFYFCKFKNTYDKYSSLMYSKIDSLNETIKKEGEEIYNIMNSELNSIAKDLLQHNGIETEEKNIITTVRSDYSVLIGIADSFNKYGEPYMTYTAKRYLLHSPVEKNPKKNKNPNNDIILEDKIQ